MSVGLMKEEAAFTGCTGRATGRFEKVEGLMVLLEAESGDF